MRLIDADRLVKTIEKAQMESLRVNVLSLIHDVPTVELQMGRMTNGIIIPIERPTGKWKITEAYPHKVYCDKCYQTYAQENWEIWKDGSLPRDFCPNCGAFMKGAEE